MDAQEALRGALRLSAGTSRLPSEVVGWIERAAAGRVTRLERLPGGNRREAWLVDLERDPLQEVPAPGGGRATSDAERDDGPGTDHPAAPAAGPKHRLFLRQDPADGAETMRTTPEPFPDFAACVRAYEAASP